MDVDPDTLLEWLQTGQCDVTLLALEQLCTVLLLSDNIDRCFESYPPRSFLPALCKIFLDEMATDSVLEATARALTYYIDVSQDCTRRIVAVDGTVRAICNRLLVIEVDNKQSKDLAEQCIKTLELICSRESAAVFEAGGLNCMLPFIELYGNLIYKDSLHSAMSVVTRLCGKMEPADSSLDFCVETLNKLLRHDDPFVADGALRCFASISDRFTRKGVDPEPLGKYGFVDELIRKLGESAPNTTSNTQQQQQQQINSAMPNIGTSLESSIGKSLSSSASSSSSSSTSLSTVTSLLSSLCRNSPAIANEILSSNIIDSIEIAVTSGDERCVLDTMRFVDLLLTLVFEGRQALPRNTIKPMSTINPAASLSLNDTTTTLLDSNNNNNNNNPSSHFNTAEQMVKQNQNQDNDKLHRQLIDWIRNKDTGIIYNNVNIFFFIIIFIIIIIIH
jgi:E3 ubiquitin-protein ligase HECTD1